MTEKLPEASPEYFLSHGAESLAQAAELARQAGWRAPENSDNSVIATYVPQSERPKPTTFSPVHESRVAARAAEFAKFPGVDAAQARSLAEQEFTMSQGSGPDRSVMAHQLAEGQTEEAITQSIDAAMEPARAPYDYTMPQHDGSPESIEADIQLRQAMFDIGLPREVGDTLARQVDETARHLNANKEQIGAYRAENAQTLKRMWGPQFDHRFGLVNDFLAAAVERSPALKSLLTTRPAFFSHWSVADALARVAESQQRTSRRHKS